MCRAWLTSLPICHQSAARATSTPQILRGKPAVHEPGLGGDRTGLVCLPLNQDCADSVLSATFFQSRKPLLAPAPPFALFSPSTLASKDEEREPRSGLQGCLDGRTSPAGSRGAWHPGAGNGAVEKWSFRSTLLVKPTATVTAPPTPSAL